MPYVDKESRIRIQEGLEGVVTVGDLNYVITKVILACWMEKPKYETLHLMRKEMLIEPKSSRFLQNLRTQMADRFTVGDIYAAAAEAYQEFRDRVGKLYEAIKCHENGDIEEYTEVVGPLLAELQNLMKQGDPKKVSLILPGGLK